MLVSPSRTVVSGLLALVLIAAFSAGASAQLVDYFGGKNKVNYDTFDWRRYDTDHFTIYYYPEEEEYLDEVVNYAETAYEIISQRLNHQLSKKIPIIYFKTHSEFEQQNVIPMFLPEGVGAFAEQRRNRLLIPLDDPPEEMQRLFTHELTHSFEYDIFIQQQSAYGQFFDQPPLWVMEGLAEHMADGYSLMDEMLVRDAVVNDFVPTIPEISQAAGFYIPYVYGNVIYNYMAETYGDASIKNFVWELRKNGPSPGGVNKAINELFKVTPDKFSRNMRQWLRDKYLPALIEKEEPEEYGEMLSDPKFNQPIFSPVPSPSGDLVACLSFAEGDIDLMLLSGEDGSLFRNLTSGYSDDYEYLVGQGVTAKFVDGRDLAWSPDGKLLAVFARRGKDRDLLLIDAVRGKIRDQIKIDADQALNPYFMPDGGSVLFSANHDGVRDIYRLNLATRDLVNLTEDEAFDYSPVASPDGKKVVYTSVVNGSNTKLFIFDINSPETKTQLTFGAYADKQPMFTPDGKRLLYISGETGIYNIYTYNLEDATISQFTDVIGGCFTPAFDPMAKDKDSIYFAGFLKRQYHLYKMDLGEPIRAIKASDEQMKEAEQAIGFTPVVRVSLEEDKMDKQPEFDFHLDDIYIYGGVASNGSVLSIASARFSDTFGDENLTVVLNTVGPYRSYGISYFNQHNRLNWGLQLYDNRTFLAGDPNIFRQSQNALVEETTVENIGIQLFTRYPLNKFYRVEFFTGFNNRNYVFDAGTLSRLTTEDREYLDKRFVSGNSLYGGMSFVGDTARYNPAFGPISGRRFNFTIQGAPGGSGDFNSSYTFTGEVRNYLKLTDSTLIATRAFYGYSGGDAPDIFIFGGLNTLRGAEFLSMVGNRAYYINNELRFPLVNFAAFPLGIRLNNIRGIFFWDIGAAWYNDEDYTFMEDGRLVDPVSSVGFGFTLNFYSFPMNFTWARTWDFKELGDDYEFDFWIGPKF